MADKLAYLKRHKWMYFLMLPGIIYFIIFKYVPMGGLDALKAVVPAQPLDFNVALALVVG